jgi:hypothetical protein
VLSLNSWNGPLLMAFPSVRVGLQLALLSVILLLSWGLYFEMSVVYLFGFWQHSPMLVRHMTLWNGGKR